MINSKIKIQNIHLCRCKSSPIFLAHFTTDFKEVVMIKMTNHPLCFFLIDRKLDKSSWDWSLKETFFSLCLSQWKSPLTCCLSYWIFMFCHLGWKKVNVGMSMHFIFIWKYIPGAVMSLLVNQGVEKNDGRFKFHFF